MGKAKIEIFSPPAQDTPYILIPDARTWEWLTEPGSACPRLEEDGQWRAGLCAAGTCESRRGRPLSNATVEPGGKPEALGSQSECFSLCCLRFFSLNLPAGKDPPTGPGEEMLSSQRQNRLCAPGQVTHGFSGDSNAPSLIPPQAPSLDKQVASFKGLHSQMWD